MNIVGDRVILTAVAPVDLDFICDLECDTAIWSFEEHVESDRDAVKRKYAEQAESAHHHNFIIRLKKGPTSQPIGLMQMWSYVEHRQSWELGYALLPEYRGNGYGSEAAKLLLNFAFSTLNTHKIVGMCHCGNRASSKLMEAIGMRRQGVFRQELSMNGSWHDQWFYEILAAEL